MISDNTLSLFRERYKKLTVDGKGDNSFDGRGLTLGLVVNTDDPLEDGRLQIYCPALNDNPKKLFHLPWAVYVTPFGGSINNRYYTRGGGDGDSVSEGAIHYGFWGVPELGAHVLVGCIDGDPRRRFWLGCVPSHQETHTQFNGRYDWGVKKGTPDGPLTSDKKPIQPIYDNWTAAFGNRKSREWKTRGADYQPTANTGSNAPNKNKGSRSLDDEFADIIAAEKDKWTHEAMGAHGYDWSGFDNTLSGFKSSRVFGISTPGFHSISMDDRPFNSRTKIRSSTGHQIIMDDTNERIYIMTNKGANWIEMDSNGNIDVFSDRRISFTATKDMNFTTGGTFRVHADQGIHMYAGHAVENGRPSLKDAQPIKGEIRIQSELDIHMLAKNIRSHSLENHYSEVGINRYDVVGGSSFLDVDKDISVRTLTGDYIKTVAANLHETVVKDSKRLTFGKNSLASNGPNEIFSFLEGLTLGSMQSMNIKSSTGDIDMEVEGKNGAGSVRVKSPSSQVSVGDTGVETQTNKSVITKAGETIGMEVDAAKVGGMSGSMLHGSSADCCEGGHGEELLLSSPVSSSVFKMTMASMTLQAATDIEMKSKAFGNFNALSNVVQTVNSTLTQLNMLTYYNYILTNKITSLASAVGESFSMPFSFDVGGISAGIFAGAMPTQLTSVYGSISALENAVTSLNIPSITTPIDINTLVNELQGNVSALEALGLPLNLNFPINPSILGGIDILGQLTHLIELDDIDVLDLPKFRPLVNKLFDNNLSSPQTTPPVIAPTTE